MGEIKVRLQSELTAAMRSKDGLRTATIRMAMAAIRTAEVAGKQARELSGDEEIAVLSKETKKRREAAQAFRDGGREDRAAQEDAEAAILAEYLPAPLTDEELGALVDAAIAETGATSPRDMGQVMKVLQPQVAGRAEGGTVAAAVKARLGPTS
jgi:uncharacterized protein